MNNRRGRVFLSSPLAVFLLIGLVAGQQTAPGDAARPSQPLRQRRDHLLRTLAAMGSVPNGSDQIHRAAEELVIIGNIDAPACKILLTASKKGLVEGDLAYQTRRIMDALAAAGPTAVLLILEEMKVPRLSEAHFLHLVRCLGYIGPPAKEAIPVLRAALEDAKLRPSVKLSIRVALANIGDDLKGNVEELLRSPEFPHGCTDTIFLLRPEKGIEEVAMKAASLDLTMLKDPKQQGPVYEGYYTQAMILGRLGERAVAAADSLHVLQRSAIKDRHDVALVFGLAYARVAPKRRDPALRELFKSFPVIFEGAGRTTIALISECPYALVDSSLAAHLAGMLEDDDPAVAVGAAWVLEWAGLAARDAFPRVLRYVKSSADAKRRAQAAIVLGRITTYSQLPELEMAVKDEKSPEVRKELQDAIEGIRNLKPKPYSCFKAWEAAR